MHRAMTEKARVEAHRERNFNFDKKDSLMNSKKLLLSGLTVFAAILAIAPAMAVEEVTIDSIEELAEYAGKSGNHVRMERGLYHMSDYFTPEKISQMNQRINKAEGRTDKREAAEFISFNGDDNVFDLRGVTLEFETEKLREPLEQIQHTPEFVMRGNNNVLKGVSIINTGNGTSNHGNVFTMSGNSNTLRDCKLAVRGSPYGFGLLLRGHSDKHSGLRITGDGNRFIGVEVHTRSLGHGYFLQQGSDNETPKNNYFENCLVQGEVRAHSEMLADLDDPDSGYEKEYGLDITKEERENLKEKLTPGRVTPLCEDGFRFYDAGETTFINCRAENMRRGFMVEFGGPVYMEGCVGVGNASTNFTLGQSDGDVMKNCAGDAKYTALLWSPHGGRRNLDVQLMPDASELRGSRTWWRIDGTGGKVSISPWKGKEGDSKGPIKLRGQNVTLRNKTSVPVAITGSARDCKVYSKGEIIQNDGENIEILGKDEINELYKEKRK